MGRRPAVRCLRPRLGPGRYMLGDPAGCHLTHHRPHTIGSRAPIAAPGCRVWWPMRSHPDGAASDTVRAWTVRRAQPAGNRATAGRPPNPPTRAWTPRGWRLSTTTRAVYPGLRSVLVVRHGVLVFEHYYHGATPATSFNVFSVTKSLTSALAGIALGEHALGGLQQPIGRLLATHLPPNPDPRLRRATLEQVLTMTAGLPAVSADGTQLGARQRLGPVRAQPASPRHAGWQVAYSSDGSHLLSAIIADSTGQPTLRYAQAKLFGPLGIASDHPFTPVFAPRNQAAYQRAGFAWPTDPQGYQLGYGFLRLTARDLARFGYLYLKGGNWQGRQVVPAAYVRAATQPHVATGSRAAVATAFQPTRRRIQAAVDRRFNRRRYDAARTIQAFNARLRDKVDLDMLAAELLSVIDQTMEPTRVSFWLRPPL